MQQKEKRREANAMMLGFFLGILKSSKDVLGKICNRFWQKVRLSIEK